MTVGANAFEAAVFMDDMALDADVRLHFHQPVAYAFSQNGQCFCDFDGLVCVEGKVFTGVSVLHGYDLPGGRGRGRAGRAGPASAPQREWRDRARAFA